MNRFVDSLRRHPWRVGVVIIIIVGGLIGYQQLTGYQQLRIDFNGISDSGAAKIYAVPNKPTDSPESLIRNLQPVRETTESTYLRLRKGMYVVVMGDVPEYNLQYEKVVLADQPVTVVVDPAYSNARLAAMLVGELPTIQAAIKQTVPGIDTQFLLGPGRLFGKGEWYGTVIYPNKTAEELRLQYVDVYHVVLKKEGGTWKVITMPPEIVLSTVTHPNIPRQVLIDTNNQKIPY